MTSAERTLTAGTALSQGHIPIENHAFIRRFCRDLGIADFKVTGSYVKGLRPEGGPALNICSGYTNGFRSEAEAQAAAGETGECWPSGRGDGQWGVTHPVHGHESSGGNASSPPPDHGVCPSCHMSLPATGRCDICDEF